MNFVIYIYGIIMYINNIIIGISNDAPQQTSSGYCKEILSFHVFISVSDVIVENIGQFSVRECCIRENCSVDTLHSSYTMGMAK